jgi:hypothetical protein
MSLLSKVTTGPVKKPHYLLMHGLPGIGKSSFAAEAPSPIFLCAEKGTSHLNVSRLELSTFGDFMGALKELFETKHDFKTVVIDTVDHLEPLIFKEVCKDKDKDSIEDIGYAKGYIFAIDYWQKLISALEILREEKGMNVILLAHTEVKTFNDPQLPEGYDRYQVKLHHKAAGLLIDRVEAVLFANYKVFIRQKKDGDKVKALGDGSRVIYTEPRPAFVAKNRYSLPFEIPLSWESFASGSETQQQKTPAELMENISELLKNVKDSGLKQKIESYLPKVKDSAVELSKVENKLKTIVSAA